VALALLVACGSAPPGQGNSDTNTDAASDADTDTGGNGSTAQGLAEFQQCFLTPQCAAEFQCIDLGQQKHCIKNCATPYITACGDARICTPRRDNPSAGFCAQALSHFDLCLPTDGCPQDSLCEVDPKGADPARCIPICDVGALGGAQAVGSCPPQPSFLGGQATVCTMLTGVEGSPKVCFTDN